MSHVIDLLKNRLRTNFQLLEAITFSNIYMEEGADSNFLENSRRIVSDILNSNLSHNRSNIRMLKIGIRTLRDHIRLRKQRVRLLVAKRTRDSLVGA